MSETTFDEAQELVDDWVRGYDDGYWKPMSMLARLAEEVGELSREFNDRYGDKTKKVENKGDEIEIELGDILFVLITIANSMDIELDETLKKVVDKYDKRDGDRWT